MIFRFELNIYKFNAKNKLEQAKNSDTDPGLFDLERLLRRGIRAAKMYNDEKLVVKPTRLRGFWMHLSLNVETGTKAIQLPTNYSLLIHAANEKVGTSKSRIKSTLVRNVSQFLEGLSERIPAGLVGAVRSGIDVNKCTKYTRKFFTKTSSFVIFRNNSLCLVIIFIF